MKKAIILIFLFIFLISLNVNARIQNNCMFAEELFRGSAPCANWTTQNANCDTGGVYISGSFATANALYYRPLIEHNGTLDSNVSILAWLNWSSNGNFEAILSMQTGNTTQDGVNRPRMRHQLLNNTAIPTPRIRQAQSPTLCSGITFPADNGRHLVNISYNSNNSITVSVDGTQRCSEGDMGAGNTDADRKENETFVYLGNPDNAGTANQFGLYNMSFENQSCTQVVDTTPPNIDFYNMTSEGGEGCTNWNTNKSNPCATNDTTPTTFIRTNEIANCSVGVSNLNYSNFGSSRNCTGAGTTEHTCTLTAQDELSQSDSNIFISCTDNAGNQNLTSTSGALAIRINAKETGAVQSIGIGVQNALLNSYSNNTNQQIYARNLNNNQFLGTFDWVAKKGDKIWAFNYISSGESHVAGTFNMTPVLYVLQLTNTTQQQVRLEVERMINATK